METRSIKISKLKNNNGQIAGVKENPRVKNDSKYQKLIKSLSDFPEMKEIRELVVVPFGDDFVVVGGNMRLKALKELGEKEVICKVLPDTFTPEQINEFIIKDNLSFGEWDFELLNDWDSIELEEWGLDLPEWENAKELEAVEDNYEVPETIHTDIVMGDLITFEKDRKELHRLMCGDSTDSDSVAKLMNGKKADMVFTDPPYGIKVVQGNKVGGDKGFGSVGGCKIVKSKIYSEIIGDDTTDTAREFYNTCISLGMENFIIWGGNYFTDFLHPSMCWLIWDKENTGNFADVEMAWTSFDKAAKLYKWQWNGMIRQGDKTIEGKTRVHPTQKPVGLFGDIFNDFKFETCFDGFLGSGSTMVAAHQLERRCYGMELDPKYVDVIVQRYVDYTGNNKIIKNGEEIIWQEN